MGYCRAQSNHSLYGRGAAYLLNKALNKVSAASQLRMPLELRTIATPMSRLGCKATRAVDTYLNTGNPEPVRTQLANFREASQAVRPVLQASPILNENIAAAEALDTLCRIGQEALNYRTPQGTPAPATWKGESESAVKSASERKGDLLIEIAPGVQKLVASVSQ